MEVEDISIGETVQLNSGGNSPIMTVGGIELKEPKVTSALRGSVTVIIDPNEYPIIHCCWFDINSHLQWGKFKPEMLTAW